MATDSMRDVPAGAFGANVWLVEEMYEAYLSDPDSVSESWREFFADYKSSRLAPAPSNGSAAPAGAPAPLPPSTAAPPPAPSPPAPGPAAAAARPAPGGPERAEPLRGVAARIAENMKQSLAVPTATSVHPVPAKLL